MAPWLTRGLVLGVVFAAAIVLQTKLVHDHRGLEVYITAVVFSLLIGFVLAWASVDGWLGKHDRWMNWFIAALIAGPLSGLLNTVGRAMFVDRTSMAELGDQLTGGAAFIALLVLVPAAVGLIVGPRLTSPRPAERPAAAQSVPAPRAQTQPEREPAKAARSDEG